MKSLIKNFKIYNSNLFQSKVNLTKHIITIKTKNISEVTVNGIINNSYLDDSKEAFSYSRKFSFEKKLKQKIESKKHAYPHEIIGSFNIFEKKTKEKVDNFSTQIQNVLKQFPSILEALNS